MSTIRIYKVAEVLGIPSQEVMDLLRTAHGIEVKSASSTIEEIVARQFAQRIARERNLDLPGGNPFAQKPAPRRGGKRGAARQEPPAPARPKLGPPRLVKAAKAGGRARGSSEPERRDGGRGGGRRPGSRGATGRGTRGRGTARCRSGTGGPRGGTAGRGRIGARCAARAAAPPDAHGPGGDGAPGATDALGPACGTRAADRARRGTTGRADRGTVTTRRAGAHRTRSARPHRNSRA
ncbi:MAG: translation initiation factor IF-2 N-terminal domain-containing protein, partial [Acidobacteria bacterium]|nr:translation initiation factor IF-2 N-terminal domain-containing protein [Acidobacteriota bacterium]